MRWLLFLLSAGILHGLDLDQIGASSPDIFASSTVIEMTLEAPFAQLFEAAQLDDNASVNGTLTLKPPAAGAQPVVINGVSVSVRGHTSKLETECDFPKLKLKFAAAQTLGGMTTLKIGTHCGDRADADLTDKYGRWANEKAPHREAFVYRLLEAMQVPTLKARAARITYVDTGREPLVRHALLVEDDSQAKKRLGAIDEITEEQFTSARDTLAPRDFARLALAEAMVGNFDWCMRFYAGDTYRCDDRHPLWNILAFKTKDGVTPLIFDFDLAGMVTGRHSWFKRIFGSFPGPEPEVEVRSQVQRTRTLFSRAELDAARAEFVRNKPAAYRTLDESPLDAGWRRTIEAYLNSFFTLIESDDRFYGPVVTAPNTRLYLDAAATQPACNEEVVMPGTPVSEPVETSGGMIRVRVLNALWQWDANSRPCNPVQEGAVWVARSSVSNDYPKK